MMHTWFECKIRYEKVMEPHKIKTDAETYLEQKSNRALFS